VPLGQEVGDRAGVLGVGLEGLIVGHIFPPLGVGRQDAHHGDAELGQEMGKGEAVVTSELDAHQELRELGPRRLLPQEGDRFLEALPSGGEAEGLGIGLALGPDDQGVGELAGVDADHGRRLLGALAPGEGDHGSTPG
jgi:hypothetical protein